MIFLGIIHNIRITEGACKAEILFVDDLGIIAKCCLGFFEGILIGIVSCLMSFYLFHLDLHCVALDGLSLPFYRETHSFFFLLP
jgi:hypothetical protein